MSSEIYSRFDKFEYLDYKELEEWSKDNKYIEKYYRPSNQSWLYYFKSLFKIHNETINIWSHLLGFFGALGACIGINLNYNVAKYESQSICLNIFIVCMMCCYLFSSIMHLLYPKCETVCINTQFLDYTGINLMIAGTFSSFIYYAFYCNIIVQKIYYSLILSLALIVIPISRMKMFSTSKYRWVRTTVFVLYGCSFIVPIIHRLSVTEINDQYFYLELNYFIASGFMYIFGIFFYVTRLPEKKFPGRFDLLGSSHQIFHIFVLLGGLITLLGCVISMNTENTITCS